MAKGDPLSHSQQKIVDRYYQNLDVSALQRVQELVSDIYLVEPGPKKDKLWRTVEIHLKKLNPPAGQLERVLMDQDVKKLAQLVAELTARKPGATTGTSSTSPIKPQPSATPSRPTTPTNTQNPTAAPQSSQSSTSPVASQVSSSDSAKSFTPDDLKMALKAFKKRLKLTRLDEESQLGRNPLTTGKGSAVYAISPPNQYPLAVWEELVKQGKLKQAGRGFYQLVGSD